MTNEELTAILKNPCTSAEWIEQEIEDTFVDDIERLCILAASDKLTEEALDELWVSCCSAKLALVIASNPVTTAEFLKYVAEATVWNYHDWSFEESSQILEAIKRNPNCTSEIEDYCDISDEDDSGYIDDDDDYADIMELINFGEGGSDNW